MHLLNFEGFNDTCGKILDNRTQLRFNWLAYAVSFDLLGDFKGAEKVLDLLEKAEIPIPETQLSKYEASEVALYRNFLIESQNAFDRCLENLDAIKPICKDKTGWMEAKARVLLKCGKLSDAELMYLELIDINPDNDAYLNGLENSKKGTDKELVQVFKDLKSKYPRSHPISMKLLIHTQGVEFEKYLSDYLVSMFRKGVPSSFSMISSLLNDKAKSEIISKVAYGFYDQLKTNGKLTSDGETEYPTVFLWVSNFLAHLYDSQTKYTEALNVMDLAIEKTPTCVELYMFKARIFKHAGDFESAMKVMDRARSLDLQDRFMNSKCTKYMLRNNDLDAAAATVALFSRVMID